MTASPVRGVTDENYVALGKAFIGSNGGAGFVISTSPHQVGSTRYPATPRQWGAWLAYWYRVGIKHRFKASRGWATTPTEWPHEFDATATVGGDLAAADAFEMRGGLDRRRRPLPELAPFRPYPRLWQALANDGHLVKILDACTFDQMTHASRLLATAGAEEVRRWILDGHVVPKVRRGPTPKEHLDPAALSTPRIDISDFPPANATPAELLAWDERQREAASETMEGD